MKERDCLQVLAQLDAVVARLQPVVEQDQAFASLAIDSSTNTVTVYRVGASTGQTAACLAVDRGGAGLEFREAILSKAQVDQLTQRISEDWRQLWSQGVRLNRAGGHGRGGPFQIGVQDAARHRAFLLGRYGQYGPGTVEVVEQPPLIPFLAAGPAGDPAAARQAEPRSGDEPRSPGAMRPA
jgi:hypothetical protein